MTDMNDPLVGVIVMILTLSLLYGWAMCEVVKELRVYLTTAFVVAVLALTFLGYTHVVNKQPTNPTEVQTE